MLARFATRELSGIDLEIEMDGSIARAVTDEEGYWDVRIAADPPPPQGGHGAGRHPVAVRVGGGLDPAAVVHRMDDDAAVLVPAPTARHLVVSDVDDTVLATGVGRTARVVARTLTSSAWSRRPVPGVPALLRSLRDGPDGCADNPCFYVSSSPWNLYGFLRAFLDRHECPLGPIVLSDYGISNEFVVRRSHQLHKLDAIDTILDIHPSTPAVLVGDTTEADPAIYLRIATERPDRVLAVLLHDDGSDASRARRADELFADVDVPVAIGDASTLTTAVARHIGSATRTR
jgi:phosphatidate phosphatase APP1